jgi:hypothetical protein
MKKFSQSLITLLAIVAFAISTNAQEIHIKSYFFEVPKETFEALQKISPVADGGAEKLSSDQMNAFYQTLNQDSNMRQIAQPEATLTSGRRVQMRATTIQTIITNFVFQDSLSVGDKTAISPQVGKIECGPILDVVPTIFDENQILLKTTAKVMTFLGYADSKNVAPHFATNSVGEQITLPTILPQFETQTVSAKTTVSDGQTVILFAKSSNAENQSPDEKLLRVKNSSVQQKFLVVMITPTIVDDSGNRIHSDN